MKAIPVRFLAVGSLALLLVVPLASRQASKTGPETEKRFPPLKVPAGFKATLFACDPLIEYPSVIARGPRPGTLYVAIDYMTGLGTAITRRDEIRLIEDSDGDGYADTATVIADGFNSIMGLVERDGTLYVMHAPFLSEVRPSKGADGKTTWTRRDLLNGLGLTPEKNPVRLHCANGVVAGRDGWLYLVMGDHGADVVRPEGDRLVLEGGGILRCRPDGRDLHIFATGLRNTYDVAHDADQNVFLRDNENDGGTYMNRICHSFFGTDHGYPYLYAERPDEALAPLADLGRGSSAGAVCYLERQFPAEYSGTMFFCEWGRMVTYCRPERAGSGFAPVKEFEFAAGGAGDNYGFKPTDLVVDRDGSLVIADWADGQQPRRGRARIYRITYPEAQPIKPAPRPTSLAGWVAQLDSASAAERGAAQTAIEQAGPAGLKAVRAALAKGQLQVLGRLHAVWILSHLAGPQANSELFELARTDKEPRVQAQAVRILADLADPVLVQHKLDAGPGDRALAARLAELARGRDARVIREVVSALGRLGWPDLPTWLRSVPLEDDRAMAHAAMQALRRARNWAGLLKLLDEKEPLRSVALRALAQRFEPAVVDGLIERLQSERDPALRSAYADLLTRVYKKRGPLVYWGYRPAPRPANTEAWEKTPAIEQALDRVLADADKEVRFAALQRMQREKIAARPATLNRWLREAPEAAHITAILQSLRDQPAAQVRALLNEMVKDKGQSEANRLAALTQLAAGLDGASEGQLLDLVRALEDGPVLAEALRSSLKRPALKVGPVLLTKLSSADPAVRAAALDGVTELQVKEAGARVLELLADKDVRVRRAATTAAGKLVLAPAAEMLLNLARDPDAAVRRASFDSLSALREPRALPLAITALADRETELAALACVGTLGGPDQAAAVTDLARRNPSAEVLPAVVGLLSGWAGREQLPEAKRLELERAVAQVHGSSGVVVRWEIAGPLPQAKAATLVERFKSKGEAPARDGAGVRWQPTLLAGADSRLNLGKPADGNTVWLVYAEAETPTETAVEMLGSCSGPFEVWLNGAPIYRRDQARPFQLHSDRFPATLAKGSNRLLIQVGAASGATDFQLRFRRKSSAAEHEKLVQTALSKKGDSERGRKLFFDVEKSLCLKCHRLADKGEPFGPELTDVGSRFSPIYIIESILEPSRTIAPSFDTLAIILKSGKVVTGVKVAETETHLTLVDNQGQKHVLAKPDVDENQKLPTSTMPDGLEKRLTADEFVDLIAFLASQRKK